MAGQHGCADDGGHRRTSADVPSMCHASRAVGRPLHAPSCPFLTRSRPCWSESATTTSDRRARSPTVPLPRLSMIAPGSGAVRPRCASLPGDQAGSRGRGSGFVRAARNSFAMAIAPSRRPSRAARRSRRHIQVPGSRARLRSASGESARRSAGRDPNRSRRRSRERLRDLRVARALPPRRASLLRVASRPRCRGP